MAHTRLQTMRRVVSIVAFVVALILLTGTPAKVREIALNDDSQDNSEYQVATQ